MSADDKQQFHPDSDSTSELDLQYTPGNRPASGARRATPGEVLSQGFQGAQNAGDFLGLDTEFTASFDPSQAVQDPGLDMVSPPTSSPEGYEGEPGQGADPGGFGAPSYEEPVSETASAFEYGQDLGEEHEDYGDGFELESEPVTSKKPILAALVVALVGFGAVFFGSDLLALFQGGSQPEVARNPAGPAPSATGGEKPAPVDTTKADPLDAQGAEPVSETTIVETPADPADSTVTGREPAAPVEVAASETIPPRPRTGRTTTRTSVEPPAAQGEPNPPDPGQGLRDLRPSTAMAPTSFPELGASDYSWASEDLLELIWRGDSIPPEAIRAPAKTLMPRVGDVRVFTTTGDLFEGRLYAVGQNRVWLDTEPGRVGLDGDHVERIEAIMASAPGGGGQAVPGRRVRVRVPGGMLFGNVLKTEGDEVMLLLEDGGKVRVKTGDIEELGSGRAIVVGR